MELCCAQRLWRCAWARNPTTISKSGSRVCLSLAPSSTRTMVTRGKLFLVGGKDGRNDDRVLIDRFARICGGAAARVLVITSASETPERHLEEYTNAFHESGVGDVSIF